MLSTKGNTTSKPATTTAFVLPDASVIIAVLLGRRFRSQRQPYEYPTLPHTVDGQCTCEKPNSQVYGETRYPCSHFAVAASHYNTLSRPDVCCQGSRLLSEAVVAADSSLYDVDELSENERNKYLDSYEQKVTSSCGTMHIDGSLRSAQKLSNL